MITNQSIATGQQNETTNPCPLHVPLSAAELLGRPPLLLNCPDNGAYLYQKCILVTGAAGSIGSALVRQLLSYSPLALVLVDQAESALYELENELAVLLPACLERPAVSLILESIGNEPAMERLFRKHRPDVIFHAAAYKHVPLMERNPAKALEVNTLGTCLLADLSIRHHVERFVFISTDKAVRPASVMGASKRLAEHYLLSLGHTANTPTTFVTARLGNVLDSNGSVLPLFRAQLQAGGPLTVTHPDVTRYFMTNQEAGALILAAGAVGTSGDIVVADMGAPVKILDLARKLIQTFSCEEPIPIVFTGLRPGEKLHEQLRGNEPIVRSLGPIHILRSAAPPPEQMNKAFILTKPLLATWSTAEVLLFLEAMIPEYRPALYRNSTTPPYRDSTEEVRVENFQ